VTVSASSQTTSIAVSCPPRTGDGTSSRGTHGTPLRLRSDPFAPRRSPPSAVGRHFLGGRQALGLRLVRGTSISLGHGEGTLINKNQKRWTRNGAQWTSRLSVEPGKVQFCQPSVAEFRKSPSAGARTAVQDLFRSILSLGKKCGCSPADNGRIHGSRIVPEESRVLPTPGTPRRSPETMVS